MKHFLALMLLVCGVTLVFAEKPQAFIREMTGTVELKTAGSEKWVPAKQGDRIQEATIISTGFKSTAMLSIGNSTLLVRALTRMSLEALMNQDETDTINVGLSTGRVRADVKPPAGSKTNLTIQTPSATASVRGTVFDLDTATVRVIEGKVSFQPSGELTQRPIMVGAGQQSWVDTQSGQAVTPLAAAESSMVLPALPGQNAAASSGGANGGGTPDNSHGNLVITVELTPKK
jgi:hypothetical protein